MNGFFSFAMNLVLYLLAILGIFTPRAAFLCPQEGSFENEEDLSTYYNCSLLNGSVSSYLEKCPEDLKFDSDAQKCVPEFACRAEGRYLNSYDPKCKSYFVCSTNENGTFFRAKYKCPENTSFDPRSSKCSTSYVCEQSEEDDDDDDDGDDSSDKENDSLSKHSAIRRLDFVCTEKGRFADLTDLTCKKYFLCSQLSNGSFIKTSYKCPISSNFDQSLGKCSASYDCFASTGVPETTTAIPEYVCTVKGRFPDLTDTTCKKYFLCSKLLNGSFIKTVYNCPATSNFNPRLKKCSANYLCHPTTTQNPTELITTTQELKPPTTSFMCTVHGRFPDPTDQNCTSYFLCSQLKNGSFIQTPYSCPPKSKFDPSLGECSATYQCAFSTTSKPSFTTEMQGYTCTDKGRFPDSQDGTCKRYYLCSLLSNGTFIKTVYNCPSTSAFDPGLRKCSKSFVCSNFGTTNNYVTQGDNSSSSVALPSTQDKESSSAATITNPPRQTTLQDRFNCVQNGRFADASDDTCKKYYLCKKLVNGTFIKYSYECPNTSAFDPSLGRCSSSYECGVSTSTRLATVTSSSSATKTSWSSTTIGYTNSSTIVSEKTNTSPPEGEPATTTVAENTTNLSNSSSFQTTVKNDPTLENFTTFATDRTYSSKMSSIDPSLFTTTHEPGNRSDLTTGATSFKTTTSSENVSTIVTGPEKSISSDTRSDLPTTTTSHIATEVSTNIEHLSTLVTGSQQTMVTPKQEFICTRTGRFPDDSDETCSRYFLCSKLHNGEFIKTPYKCPGLSTFDPSLDRCSKSYICPWSKTTSATKQSHTTQETMLSTISTVRVVETSTSFDKNGSTNSNSPTTKSESDHSTLSTNLEEEGSTLLEEEGETSDSKISTTFNKEFLTMSTGLEKEASTILEKRGTTNSSDRPATEIVSTMKSEPTLENSKTFATDRTYSPKMSSLDPSLFTTNHESDNRSDLPTTTSPHIATEVSKNIEHLSTVVTGSVQTTVTPKQEFICTRTGRFPDDSDETCSRYFLCSKLHNEEFIKTPYKCPGLSTFDPSLGRCSKSYICPWSKTTGATNQSHTTQETMLSTISTVLGVETSALLEKNGSTNSNSPTTKSESDHSTLSTMLEEQGSTLLEEEGETSDSKISTAFNKEISTMSTGLENEASTILEEQDTTKSSDRPATEVASTMKPEPTLENSTTFTTDRTLSSKMSSIDPGLFTTNHEPDNRSELTTGATSFKTTTSSENVFTIATRPEESSLSNNRSDLPTTTSPHIATEVTTNMKHLSTVVTGSEQTMETPKQEFICTRTGRFPDDSDETCSRYFLCSKLHNEEFIKTPYKCPGLSIFDPSLGRCSKGYICPWSKTTSATNQSHTTQETMLSTISTVLGVETSTSLDENGSTNSNSPTTKSESDHSTLSTKLEEEGSTLLEEEGETSDSKISTAFNKELSTMSTGLENGASTILEERGTTNSSDRPVTEIVSTIKSETSLMPETNQSNFSTSMVTSTENGQKISTDLTTKETSDSTEGSLITSTLTESTGKSTNLQDTKTSIPFSSTSTVSTSKVTSVTLADDFVCTKSGRFPDYTDTTCKRYFLCSQMPNGDFTKTLYYCPGISSFDPQLQKCTDSFVCPRSTTKDAEITESGKITPEYTAGTLEADYSTTALQEEQSTSFNEKKTTISPQDSTMSTQFNEEQTSLSEGGSTVTSKENATTKIEETTLSSQISNEISTSSEDARNSSPTTSESSMISTNFEEKDTTQFGNEETTNTHENSKTEINDNPSTVPTFTSTEEKGATNVSSTKTENDYSSLSSQRTVGISTSPEGVTKSSTTKSESDYSTLSTIFEEKHTTQLGEEVTTSSYESPKSEINEDLSTVPTPGTEEDGTTNGSNSSSTKTENNYSTISSQITEGIATSPEGTITSLTTKSESNSTLSTTFEEIHTTQLGDDETTSSYKSSSTVPTFTLTEEEGASNKLSTETGNDYSTTLTKSEEKQTTLVEGETSVSKDPTTNIGEFSTTSTVTENKPSTPLEEVTTSDFSRPATSILSTIESESFSTPETSPVNDFTTQATENISTDSEASDSTEGSFSSSTLLESTKDKPKPTTHSTSKITSTTPSNEFVCSISGRFPDYTDTTCKRYFLCSQMPNGDFTKTLYYCPGISSFDPQLQKCTDSFVCPRSTTKDTATTVTSRSTIGGKSSTFGYTTIIEDKTTASQEQELTSRFTTKDTATTDFGSSSSTIGGESNSTASTSGYTTSSGDTTTASQEEQSTSTSTTKDAPTTESAGSTITGESNSTASTSGYTTPSDDTTTASQEEEFTSRSTTKDTATTDFGASSSTIGGESNSSASTSGYTTSSEDTTTASQEEQSTSTSTPEDTATTELGTSSSTIIGESDSTASTWGTSGYTKSSEVTSQKQFTSPFETSTDSSSNIPTMSTQFEDEVTTSYEEGSTATNTKTSTESFSSLSTQITNKLSTLSDSSTAEPKSDYTTLSTLSTNKQYTTTSSYEISTGSTGLENKTSTPDEEEGSSTKLEEELQTTSFEEESTSYNSSTAVTIEPSSTPEREGTSETVNEDETKETTLKTTEPPQQEFYCQQRGYFANELDSTCQTFHFCDVMGDGRIYGYTLQCPRSYLFNPSTNLCTTNHSCNQTRKIELNLSLNLPNIERNLTFVSYL